MILIEHSIDDIALVIKTGTTPPTSNPQYFNGEINWLTPSDLKGQKYVISSERKISKLAIEDKKSFLFEPETIIISTIGDIGKSCIIKEPAASNQQLTGIKVNKDVILPELFYYWIQRSKNLLENKANKAIISILSNKLLRKIKISFPESINEQIKIVSRLNKIQELIDKRIETINLLDNFIQSVFLEMFLENLDSKNWETKSIKNSRGIKETTYGTAKKANSDEIGVPVLRMNNISYSGEISKSDIKWVELSSNEKEKLTLQNRQVLFNRTNSPDLVGKIAVWDQGDGYTFAGYLIRMTMNEKVINPYYFSSYFNSSFGKKILMNKARPSGSLANISATTLINQNILIPPIGLQKKYESIFLKIQSLKSICKKSLYFLEILFQSALENAFREDVQFSEEKIFEDLLKNLSIEDFKQGKRLQYLVNWLDKEKQRFTNFDNYKLGLKKALELLEDGSIEQVLEKGIVKLKARK